MQPYSPAIAVDTETEYRAIEATLLETVRGRWFLAEHGRRARRLDSALLEDAIRRLQASLREPPALLGQLKGEIEAVQGAACRNARRIDRTADGRRKYSADARDPESGGGHPRYRVVAAGEPV